MFLVFGGLAFCVWIATCPPWLAATPGHYVCGGGGVHHEQDPWSLAGHTWRRWWWWRRQFLPQWPLPWTSLRVWTLSSAGGCLHAHSPRGLHGAG